MKKILVLSDSHGNPELVTAAISLEQPLDYIIFCGDGLSDLVQADVPGDIPLMKALGNVDRSRNLMAEEKIYISIENNLLLICHGDMHGVKTGLHLLRNDAREHQVDIVCFGHTHVQYVRETDECVLFNPGALRDGYYGVIEIVDNVPWRFLHKSIS